MVLHPVLADLAGFPVGDQFIGVEGHVNVEVVVNHHLKGPALDAVAPVGIHGAAGDPAGRPEPVTVDPPPGDQFIEKFRRQRAVPFFRDIPQGVFHREDRILAMEAEMAIGRPADMGGKFRHGREFGKDILELDGHGPGDFGV